MMPLMNCKNDNLQNDQRFVEAYVRSKSKRGNGPKKIAYEIKSKKVASHLVSAALALEPEEWLQIAFAALSKRYTWDMLQDYATKQKAFQYLLRKGHDTAIIYQAFAMLEQATIEENE